MLLKRDYKNLVLIFIYCFVFLLLRLSASINGFTFDEAEQLFDSQEFYLGYSDQPPLFSWILKTLSLVFGLNIPLMMITTHSLIFIFFGVFYLIARKLWDEKQSLIISSSLVFIFLYSYDYYRYMIHSILMTTIAAISLLIYLNLLEKKSTLNYILLGLSFALGMLSKYNFLLFIAILVLSSLSFKEGRKVFFSYKTLLSLVCFSLVLAPHTLWLIDNDFITLNYAMDRSQAGSPNLGIIQVLEVLWLGFWNHLLYLIIFLCFFFNALFFKRNEDNSKIQLLRWLAIYSILVPIIMVLALKTGNLTNRWLATLYFPFILGLFTLVDFSRPVAKVGLEQKQVSKKNFFKRERLFLSAVIILVLVIYGIKAISYFLPDYYGLTFVHNPYKAVYGKLEERLKDQGIIKDSITEVKIYSFREIGNIAAIKLFYPQAKLGVLKKGDKLNLEQKAILIWNPDKFKPKAIKHELAKQKLHYKNLFTLKAKYLHSQKDIFYRIKVIEIY